VPSDNFTHAFFGTLNDSMHHRRLASFLIGVWIAGSLLMAFVATQNLFGVDRILAAPKPGLSQIIGKLGPENARMLLRYQASEQNRSYLATWELAQMVLGIGLVTILYLGTHVNRLMIMFCGFMVLLVIFMHFFLTPEIAWTGRSLDFVPRSTANYNRLWVLQVVYCALELLKVLLACLLAGYLFIFKARPRTPRNVEQRDSRLSPSER
jgi:hypothetical protein